MRSSIEPTGTRPAAPPRTLHAYVDLHQSFGDLAEWSARHARGEVASHIPYGLDELARFGIEPAFRPRTGPRLGRIARKVRNRLDQADVVSVGAAALRRERRTADVVLCWDERNGIPAALVPGGPPVVSGAFWLTFPERVAAAALPLVRRALPRMAGLFHFTAPTAEAIGRAWDLPPGRVHRITMGVDPRYFRALPPAPAPGVVVSVGDDRMRDHDLLVDAVGKVRAGGLDVRLELATQLRTEVPAELGTVHRRRMEGSILELYGRSSVVAVAARPAPASSGLTVLLEAMACARPVVITGNPGFEEYVEHGVTGLLVPPDDPDAFADAVASLVADPAGAREMGLAGRRAVERRFTTSHIATDIAALLHSLA